MSSFGTIRSTSTGYTNNDTAAVRNLDIKYSGVIPVERAWLMETDTDFRRSHEAKTKAERTKQNEAEYQKLQTKLSQSRG
jgi:hypothetical protein